MTAPFKTALVVLATSILASAAIGAPNTTPDPAAKCPSDATLQFQLDYAQCQSLYPPQATELRGQCESAAIVKYGSALAACGNKSASVQTGASPKLKQSTDSGFLRRLRF